MASTQMMKNLRGQGGTVGEILITLGQVKCG